jgi:hypothetical protein
MQLKVKLPFNKFSRLDAGHAIQVMALDCRVIEFYSPQEALLEFEPNYIDGLNDGDRGKYLALLADYVEPQPEFVFGGVGGDVKTEPDLLKALTIGEAWGQSKGLLFARFARDFKLAVDDMVRAQQRNGDIY